MHVIVSNNKSFSLTIEILSHIWCEYYLFTIIQYSWRIYVHRFRICIHKMPCDCDHGNKSNCILKEFKRFMISIQNASHNKYQMEYTSNAERSKCSCIFFSHPLTVRISTSNIQDFNLYIFVSTKCSLLIWYRLPALMITKNPKSFFS